MLKVCLGLGAEKTLLEFLNENNGMQLKALKKLVCTYVRTSTIS